MEAVKNGKTRNVLFILACVIVSLIALASFTVSILLFNKSISDQKEIKGLIEEVASLKGSLQGSSGTLAIAEDDIVKLKEDVHALMSDRSIPKPNFKVGSFQMEQSKGGFDTGRAPYWSYETTFFLTGTGTVSCDSNSPYMVLLKATKSVQNSGRPEEQVLCVYVINGEGKFTTSEWTIEYKRANPEYKFEILAYMPVSTAN